MYCAVIDRVHEYIKSNKMNKYFLVKLTEFKTINVVFCDFLKDHQNTYDIDRMFRKPSSTALKYKTVLS